jgi:hypothetical protein
VVPSGAVGGRSRDPAGGLVASGHVHQHLRRRAGALEYCWAPATAFVISDERQPRIGIQRVGYVQYTFRHDAVDIDIVEAPELINYNLDDFWKLDQHPGGPRYSILR